MDLLDYWRRRLTRAKVAELLKLWLAETSAARAAEIAGVNRKTALRQFRRFRLAASGCQVQQQLGDAEIDECYLGSNRHSKAEGAGNKRGRSYDGKIVLLGAVDRHTGVGHAETTERTDRRSLFSFVHRAVKAASRVITDGFIGYKGLGREGYRHSQVNHAKGLWKRGDGHTNRVENLWRQIRRRLNCYNGAWKRWRGYFRAFLGEALFFFNYRGTSSRAAALGVDSLWKRD